MARKPAKKIVNLTVTAKGKVTRQSRRAVLAAVGVNLPGGSSQETATQLLLTSGLVKAVSVGTWKPSIKAA